MGRLVARLTVAIGRITGKSSAGSSGCLLLLCSSTALPAVSHSIITISASHKPCSRSFAVAQNSESYGRQHAMGNSQSAKDQILAAVLVHPPLNVPTSKVSESQVVLMRPTNVHVVEIPRSQSQRGNVVKSRQETRPQKCMCNETSSQTTQGESHARVSETK